MDCLSTRTIPFHFRLLGPSMSGKTSFLQYLQHRQFVETEPTDNMEISRVLIHNHPCFFWDSRKFGLPDMMPARPVSCVLKNSTPDSTIASHNAMIALIFVVDASNLGRLGMASREFESTLKVFHKVPIILILATKIDKAATVSKELLRNILRVPEIASNRESAIFLISNVTGDGVDEAIEWLYIKAKESQTLWNSWIKATLLFRFKMPALGSWDPVSCCRYSRLT